MQWEQSQSELVAGRVTLEQRNAVEAIAAAAGVSVSAVVRAAVARLVEAPTVAVERYAKTAVERDG